MALLPQACVFLAGSLAPVGLLCWGQKSCVWQLSPFFPCGSFCSWLQGDSLAMSQASPRASMHFVERSLLWYNLSASQVKLLLYLITWVMNSWVPFHELKGIAGALLLSLCLSTLLLFFNLFVKDYIIYIQSDLYWSIVDLQCCVSFRCTANWFSYFIHVCVYM